MHFTWNSKFKLPMNLIKAIYFILPSTPWLQEGTPKTLHSLPPILLDSVSASVYGKFLGSVKGSHTFGIQMEVYGFRWWASELNLLPIHSMHDKVAMGPHQLSFNSKLGRGSFQKLCNDLVFECPPKSPVLNIWYPAYAFVKWMGEAQ